MTSLPLFHRAMVCRIRNLDRRRTANLPGEPVGGVVPLLARALGDVDLAAESLLGALGCCVGPKSATSTIASGRPDRLVSRPSEQDDVSEMYQSGEHRAVSACPASVSLSTHHPC